MRKNRTHSNTENGGENNSGVDGGTEDSDPPTTDRAPDERVPAGDKIETATQTALDDYDAGDEGQSGLPTIEIDEPLYHGTDSGSADGLVEHGISEDMLQRRDRGFHGEGFYVTNQKDTAEGYAQNALRGAEGGAVVQVTLNDPEALDMSKMDVDPDEPPEWQDDFEDFVEERLDEAAVWEKIDGVERSDIIPSGIVERRPGHEDFDRDKWVSSVVDYADENGYDAIYWADSQIVVRPGADVEIEHAQKDDE